MDWVLPQMTIGIQIGIGEPLVLAKWKYLRQLHENTGRERGVQAQNISLERFGESAVEVLFRLMFQDTVSQRTILWYDSDIFFGDRSRPGAGCASPFSCWWL